MYLTCCFCVAKKRWPIRRRLRGSHEQNLRHKICYFKTLGYLQKRDWSVKITKLQPLDFILRSRFILSTIFPTLIWFISMYYWKFIPRFRSWVEFSNFVMFTLWMGIRRQRAKFVTFKMIKVSVYRISFWIIVKWNPSAQKKIGPRELVLWRRIHEVRLFNFIMITEVLV